MAEGVLQSWILKIMSEIYRKVVFHVFQNEDFRLYDARNKKIRIK